MNDTDTLTEDTVELRFTSLKPGQKRATFDFATHISKGQYEFLKREARKEKMTVNDYLVKVLMDYSDKIEAEEKASKMGATMHLDEHGKRVFTSFPLEEEDGNIDDRFGFAADK